jgi:serine/threonine protein kinase
LANKISNPVPSTVLFSTTTVAMHLDLKPRNLMYFRGLNGAKVLKAIDFGASKMLREKDRELSAGELKNRANYCRKIFHPVATPRYDGPEINHKNVCVSASWEKSDESTSDHNLVIYKFLQLEQKVLANPIKI